MSFSQIEQNRLEHLRIERVPYPEPYPWVFKASHELSEVELHAVLAYERECLEVKQVNAELDLLEERMIANDPILRKIRWNRYLSQRVLMTRNGVACGG